MIGRAGRCYGYARVQVLRRRRIFRLSVGSRRRRLRRRSAFEEEYVFLP